MKRRVSVMPKKGCREDSPLGLCREAIDALRRCDGMPAQRVREEIAGAEITLVRLRDCLIDRRRVGVGEEEIFWRLELDQVNTVLSLIAGIAYPSSKFQAKYVEAADTMLDRVQRELER